MKSDFAVHEIDLLAGSKDDAFFQIDDAVPAEGRDGGAGLRGERDELVSDGDVENALVSAVAPIHDAASRQLTRRRPAALPFVLAVHPQHFAGGRVDREGRPPRARRRVHHTVYDDRRRLELEFLTGSEVVGLQAPRDLERAEVVDRDLIQR